MWSILQNRDTPPLLVTAKFAIHKLCVDMCTWLSCFRIHFSSKVTVSPTLIRVQVAIDWITIPCPGLLEVSTRLLVVGYPASLCCWLASSWCLLWWMGWRWCLCFPWDVSSFDQVLICGQALLIPYHSAIYRYIFLDQGPLCTKTVCAIGCFSFIKTAVWVVCEIPLADIYWWRYTTVFCKSHLQLFNIFNIFGA